MKQADFSRSSRTLLRSTMDGAKDNCLPIEAEKVVVEMCDCQRYEQDGLPKYSSPLIMVQKIAGIDRKLRVVLKVYSTVYGLYAVVSQDRAIVKDCGYINLKTCTVLTNECDLSVQLIQRNCEGLTLTFKVSNLDEHKKLSNILNPGDCNSGDDSSDTGSDKENTMCDSKLNKMWKRDISPRSTPAGGRKTSLPALDEGVETEDSDSEEK